MGSGREVARVGKIGVVRQEAGWEFSELWGRLDGHFEGVVWKCGEVSGVGRGFAFSVEKYELARRGGRV